VNNQILNYTKTYCMERGGGLSGVVGDNCYNLVFDGTNLLFLFIKCCNMLFLDYPKCTHSTLCSDTSNAGADCTLQLSALQWQHSPIYNLPPDTTWDNLANRRMHGTPCNQSASCMVCHTLYCKQYSIVWYTMSSL